MIHTHIDNWKSTWESDFAAIERYGSSNIFIFTLVITN